MRCLNVGFCPMHTLCQQCKSRGLLGSVTTQSLSPYLGLSYKVLPTFESPNLHSSHAPRGQQCMCAARQYTTGAQGLLCHTAPLHRPSGPAWQARILTLKSRVSGWR